MARLSRNQWFDVRDKWENDPKLSFGVLATEYGITKQTICSRSKKESWKRHGNLAAITQEAYKRADAFDEKTDETLCLKGDVGFDEAVDKRADVLVKHRLGIVALDTMQDAAKSLFDEAMKARITAENAGDEQKVKTAKNLFWQAKIAADIVKDHCAAIKIKHAAERVAWGMDELTLSREDLESMTKDELNSFKNTGKLPMRLRKVC
jgi:hypothetical protein